jgi:hypothetical protein
MLTSNEETHFSFTLMQDDCSLCALNSVVGTSVLAAEVLNQCTNPVKLVSVGNDLTK